MKLKPYIEFFGSLVDASIELDLLKEYILHMDQSLQQAKTTCANSVQAMSPSLQAIATDKAELLAEQFPKLLHAGFLISVIIFLEQQLASFSQSLERVENLGLSIKDLSGSFIERFRKYCEHIAKLPFLVSNENWEDLRGVLEIRNCLVHNNGLLDGFNRANTVQAFIKRHGTPKIENGFLCANTETSQKVLDIVEIFVESIYKTALYKYPDKNKPRGAAMLRKRK